MFFHSFVNIYLFTCQSVHKHVLSSYYVNNTMVVTVLLPAGPIKKTNLEALSWQPSGKDLMLSLLGPGFLSWWGNSGPTSHTAQPQKKRNNLEILSLNVGVGGGCLVQFLSFHNLVGFNEVRMREQALPVTDTATLSISKATLCVR